MVSVASCKKQIMYLAHLHVPLHINLLQAVKGVSEGLQRLGVESYFGLQKFVTWALQKHKL